MKKLLLLLPLAFALNTYAQDWPVKTAVANAQSKRTPFAQLPAFTFVANRTLAGRGLYQELKLNAAFQQQILQEQPAALRFSLPLSKTEVLVCELVRFSLGNIKFTANNNEVLNNIDVPLTYRGIVSGESRKHNLMLTVNKDYVSFTGMLPDRVVQITKADETDESTYRLYNSRKLQFPPVVMDCGTADTHPSPPGIVSDGTVQARTAAVQDKCVNVFVDCFDSLYQWRSSNSQQTINYVTELFNLVATGFLNDSVNIQVAAVNVWTTPDPYRGDNRTNALADLAANYQDNFWGNICVGLDFSLNTAAGLGRSGLAGGFGVAKAMAPDNCKVYSASNHQFCYCDMNYNVQVKNFPTGPNATQQQVYLTMHEMGHLLGSRHTKWCGWKIGTNPDVFGALDTCSAQENGPCPSLLAPASGATIMSYCVSGPAASDSVNFNNGFGPLPGAVIRNFVANTTCIPRCLDCLIGFRQSKSDWALERRRRTLSPTQQPATGNGQRLLTAERSNVNSLRPQLGVGIR